MKFATLALVASVNAVSLSQMSSGDDKGKIVNGKYWFCDPPLPHTEKQLDIELDFLSRNFDRKHYDNAIEIYTELNKKGQHPRVNVHTW